MANRLQAQAKEATKASGFKVTADMIRDENLAPTERRIEMTSLQKQLAREHGGNATPYDDTFESVESSCAEVKRLIVFGLTRRSKAILVS